MPAGPSSHPRSKPPGLARVRSREAGGAPGKISWKDLVEEARQDLARISPGRISCMRPMRRRSGWSEEDTPAVAIRMMTRSTTRMPRCDSPYRGTYLPWYLQPATWQQRIPRAFSSRLSACPTTRAPLLHAYAHHCAPKLFTGTLERLPQHYQGAFLLGSSGRELGRAEAFGREGCRCCGIVGGGEHRW